MEIDLEARLIVYLDAISSINSAENLGEVSLSVLYAFILLGSLFGPMSARLIGHKGLLCLGFLGHLCYTCANLMPVWGILIPVSAVLGLSAAGIGMSRGVYLTALSRSYIHFKNLPKSELYATMSFFSGFYYFGFKATQITGNLMSSAILQSKTYNESILRENKCGARLCSSFEGGVNFDKPSKSLLNILFGCFAIFNIAGFAIAAIGLPYLKNTKAKDESKNGVRDHALGCLSMMVNPKFMVLIPYLMAQPSMIMVTYTGYTKAFVSCTVGVQWVGYSMVALGIVSSITALTTSYAARYTGRILQFATGMGIDLATLMVMLMWEPDYRTSPSVLLVLPMVAGFAQGILQPQNQALISSVFSKEELPSAYAASNGVRCLGFSIYLCTVSVACFYHGLILTLALYLPGVVGYAYTEIKERKAGRDL
ncbi:hypothetical protein EGW08_005399 [Elysia chlorotica]|uniref:Major facilitator superfamily (MFS) profile domain-containing protein n=1 Tax=Elysia chlorotica TaxID=188477 RepID=A0A3S1C9U8_ELYCH|nr:hypothetical protein EGW08_005399 [Elysia chlorotica]